MTVRQWLGLYQAVVVRNDDPLGSQRVTLRIPQVLGTAVSQWASPLSAMATAAPSVGTSLTVMFLGGDINHPVYLAPVQIPSIPSIPVIDTTAADIQPLGIQAAGSTGKAADAGHVHPPTGLMVVQASTSASGYTLVNGTGNVISWTTPNDGAMHRVLAVATLHITSNETGGSIKLSATAPDGTAMTPTLISGGLAASVQQATFGCQVKANTTVAVQQGAALTAGAAVLWCDIIGA